jgi:hypothetical protein
VNGAEGIRNICSNIEKHIGKGKGWERNLLETKKMSNRKLHNGSKAPQFVKLCKELFPSPREIKEAKSALAWMKAQAKAIQPDIADDLGVFYLARIIAPHIVLKKCKNRNVL